MKKGKYGLAAFAALTLTALSFPVRIEAQAPDLTVGTNRFAVDRTYTYSLGPTGMRGWLSRDGNNVGDNGAVGGTRIDQHQANPDNHYDTSGTYSMYGNLLTRVAAAKLTHGVLGILWHQGENNSGADSPTGDWDYKSYQQYFVDMSAAWKQDYPNVQHYYIFQVWPNPCSMGGKESSDMLREVQRTLPHLFSKMSLMSTLGLLGYEGCHFSPLGYQQIAAVIGPLVEQNHYGLIPAWDVTAPDLKKACFTTTNRNEIALEFGQDMTWNSAATANFYLDRLGNKVTSGSVSGNVVRLQLADSSTNQTISGRRDGLHVEQRRVHHHRRRHGHPKHRFDG